MYRHKTALQELMTTQPSYRLLPLRLVIALGFLAAAAVAPPPPPPPPNMLVNISSRLGMDEPWLNMFMDSCIS